MHRLSSFLPLLSILALVQPSMGEERNTAQLEQRLLAIDTELEQLAQYSLRSGIGAIGFRSSPHLEPNNLETIQIDLGGEYPIDQIVLSPAVYRNVISDFQADAFPLEFKILAGTNDTSYTIGSYTAEDGLLPRLAPLVVSFPHTVASWVRIEANLLTPRSFDGKYSLELSEILVFSGQENIALHKPVTVSSIFHSDGTVRHKQYLVDGFLPYLMNGASGEQSVSFAAPIPPNTIATLTIDLESSQEISSIQLHATDQSDTVPQGYSGSFGLPKLLTIEGANQADFSDVEQLSELSCNSPFEAGPIMIKNFAATPCRYVRLRVVSPYLTEIGDPKAWIGFAEIELYSNGKNVALHKNVTANISENSSNRAFSNLTDGNNLYGQILPIRDWLEQLAHRHELEHERPRVATELNLLYVQQKNLLRRLGWLSALLVVAIGFTILIGRMIRMRQMVQIKTRFAADLHDELGANLHSIGLLSDIGEEAETSKEWKMISQRIREITERTGTAIRHCTNMLEADKMFVGLVADMQRAAERISTNLEHTFDIEGEEHLNRLTTRTGIDLFLFYKECLINICRHSGATRVCTILKGNGNEVNLTIIDNGHGLPNTVVPKSLKRRAKLLRAKVTVESSHTAGTSVHLKLQLSRFSLKKNLEFLKRTNE